MFYYHLLMIINKIPINDPSSNFNIIYELLCAIIVIMMIFYLSINITFNIHYSNFLSSEFWIFGIIILLMNIILILNTGYYNKGELETNCKKIAY